MEMWIRLAPGHYSMVSTDHADKAMRLIAEEEFDLVVIDSWLADVGGLELCRKIKAMDADLPIMFFSADARRSEIDAAVAAGANLYLTKPATGDEFVDAIEKLTHHECAIASV